MKRKIMGMKVVTKVGRKNTMTEVVMTEVVMIEVVMTEEVKKRMMEEEAGELPEMIDQAEIVEEVEVATTIEEMIEMEVAEEEEVTTVEEEVEEVIEETIMMMENKKIIQSCSLEALLEMKQKNKPENNLENSENL